MAVRAGADDKLRVVVTGAAGRTGALVVKKLLGDPEKFDVRAVVRSQQSASKVEKLGLSPASVFNIDVSSATVEQLAPVLEGAAAVVIATSAVPELVYTSLLKVFWAKITGAEGVRPDFTWKAGQIPEQADWLGQKVQVDAAKAAGVKQVVLISSMGGTDPEHPLNKLGNGNILQWKRRAEQYLVASGLDYTIIHPGGLIDQPGGQRRLVLGVDDTLLKRTSRSIPREDVAALAVAAVGLPAARNRAIDVVSDAPADAPPTADLAELMVNFTENCDYALNSQLATTAA